MAKQAPVLWLDEPEAAKKVKRAERTLRQKVKSGEWPVAFRTIQGRSFQYAEADLEKVFTYHFA